MSFFTNTTSQSLTSLLFQTEHDRVPDVQREAEGPDPQVRPPAGQADVERIQQEQAPVKQERRVDSGDWEKSSHDCDQLTII